MQLGGLEEPSASLPSKVMNKHVFLLLVSVVVVLLVGGVLLARISIGALLYKTRLLPTRTLTTTPTSSPTRTRIPTFTQTSAPTSTHTPTPTVTLTPTPTSTSQPVTGPSLRVQLYFSAITAKGETLSQTLQDLGELLQAPQFTDPNWKREVAAQVTAINLIHRELAEMEVPIEMVGVQSALLDATFDCDEAMFFLDDVDHVRLSDVRIASRLTGSCREKFFRITQTLQEYMAQFE